MECALSITENMLVTPGKNTNQPLSAVIWKKINLTIAFCEKFCIIDP